MTKRSVLADQMQLLRDLIDERERRIDRLRREADFEAARLRIAKDKLDQIIQVKAAWDASNAHKADRKKVRRVLILKRKQSVKEDAE